ncbi:hypothetical protein E2C01_096420 [Portunus trituberculatus]|uniref:Secreted protein n=1 Tax=Portunus trituberculatus TaxID=210409 RepID=A0A5B7K868_PORTR|nr:hypothetical protein [Portunus trituberculatus]
MPQKTPSPAFLLIFLSWARETQHSSSSSSSSSSRLVSFVCGHSLKNITAEFLFFSLHPNPPNLT